MEIGKIGRPLGLLQSSRALWVAVCVPESGFDRQCFDGLSVLVGGSEMVAQF